MRIEHVAAAYMLVASHLKMTPKDAGSILVGFINGLSKEDHLNEIQTCIDGAENLKLKLLMPLTRLVRWISLTSSLDSLNSLRLFQI